MRTGKKPTKLVADLEALEDMNEFENRCDEYGVFTNLYTLEVDLFNKDEDYRDAVIETLREGPFGPERLGWIDNWEKEPNELENDKFLALVDQIGKGRVAQRLGARIADLDPPDYISKAIKFVVDRV